MARRRSSRTARAASYVPPDDRDALAAALVEAVNEPDERRRRGRRAAELAREKYAWPALAERVARGLRRGGGAGAIGWLGP